MEELNVLEDFLSFSPMLSILKSQLFEHVSAVDSDPFANIQIVFRGASFHLLLFNFSRC